MHGRPLHMSWQGLSKVNQIFLHPSDLFAHTKPNYIQFMARLRFQPFVFAGWLGGWRGCSCQITNITCKSSTVTQLIKNTLHMTTAVDIIIPLSPPSYTVPEVQTVSTLSCKERVSWHIMLCCSAMDFRHFEETAPLTSRCKRSMKVSPDLSTTEDKGTLFLLNTEKH